MECSKVCTMSLFHTGVSKHLRLEEFDQAQHQASMQVRVIRIMVNFFDIIGLSCGNHIHCAEE